VTELYKRLQNLLEKKWHMLIYQEAVRILRQHDIIIFQKPAIMMTWKEDNRIVIKLVWNRRDITIYVRENNEVLIDA